MAKLHFHYGAMNSGKSAKLLQVKHNYEEQGMTVQLCTPKIDDRAGSGIIKSRIGISSPALPFEKETDFYTDLVSVRKNRINCVIIDEAQFLTKRQVLQLARIVDEYNVPVMCFGLRTDFMGNFFEGSQTLMELADTIEENKTICKCGRKATMVIRSVNGKPTRCGAQVQIGDQEYASVCRKHYMEAVNPNYEN